MKAFLSCLLILLLSSCQTSDADKHLARLHLKQGSKLMKNGQFERALAEMIKANELHPSDPEILNHLGLAYFFKDDVSNAISYLRVAARKKENYSEANNNLGRVLISAKKYDEARVHLNLVRKDLTYPYPDKVYFNIGLSFFDQKKYKPSLPFFAKSIELNRDQCLAYTYYGKSHYELSNFSKSRKSLKRAIKRCKNEYSQEAYYFSSMATFRSGKREDGIAKMEELLKYHPKGKWTKKAISTLNIMKLNRTK